MTHRDWRSVALRSALAVLVCMAPPAVEAQGTGPRWQVTQPDPKQPPVAIVPGSGAIIGMGLACEGAQAFVLINLVRPIGSGRANGVLVVDGASYPLTFSVVGQPARLFGPVIDPALITALASGRSVAVMVNGRAIGSLPLTGASPALSQALASCWQRPAAAVAADASAQPLQRLPIGEGPRPVLPPAERAAIMRVAGFTLRKGKWSTCDGGETGDIASFEDMNGDGTAEALITSHGTACHGFVGSGFTLLTRRSGAWDILVQVAGIPTFYRRDGSSWPDIEVGGPGTNCFPLLRWHEGKYIRAGTALEGKVCTLEPPFAAAPPTPALPALSAVAAPSAAAGVLGQVPVRLGYYVRRGTSCTAPTYLYKFERARHLEIVPEKGRVDVLRYNYARMSRQKDGVYDIAIANPGPEDLPELGLRPTRDGGIDLLYQGTTSLIPCQDDQIPARLKR